MRLLSRLWGWLKSWVTLAAAVATLAYFITNYLGVKKFEIFLRIDTLFVTQLLGFGVLAYFMWQMRQELANLRYDIIHLSLRLAPRGAQSLSEEPEEPERGPATTGAGAFGGMVVGGAVGLGLAGPLGVFIGGALGALIGNALEKEQRRSQEQRAEGKKRNRNGAEGFPLEGVDDC